MVVLITGSTHTGKTLAAQRLLEQYGFPYLSIDHLKMGLIRSGVCPLSPESDDRELTPYLWKIVKEMVKTAIENRQNLTVEGCYIPFDWKKDFDGSYLAQIRYICLVFSEKYINSRFADILRFANVVEQRIADKYCTRERLLEENRYNLQMCREHGNRTLLIEDRYAVDLEL